MEALLGNHLDEIYPNLWLGNITAAESAEILESHAITDIISITSHRPKIPKGLNIRKKHFRLRDNTTADLLSILPECISRLESILSEEDGGIDELGRQRRVLVHCRVGMSRSGGIVVAYAMKFAQIPASLALEYVRSRRPIVHPNRAFMAQLTVWGECGYDTALLVHADDEMKEPEEIEPVEEEQDDEEELLRKALEMSLLPESEGEGSGGGKESSSSMDWVGVEVKPVLEVGKTEKENEEKKVGSQDVEMGEEPLSGNGKGKEVLREGNTVHGQVISSYDAGDLIVPHNLSTPPNDTTPAIKPGGDLHPTDKLQDKEGPTPITPLHLHPEQRQRDKGKDIDKAGEAEDPLSQEGGWAEVVMGDGMKRCFEECVRDIDRELGLGWAVTTSI